MQDYQKDKGKRILKFKEEKTLLERHLKRSIDLQTWANYFLMVISMVVIGIFVKLLVITW